MMLENATTPNKPKHKRGRPKDKKETHISEELEELTIFETAILKIYEELSGVIESPILLEGNSEVNPQAYDR
jgi:hypothetical protein